MISFLKKHKKNTKLAIDNKANLKTIKTAVTLLPGSRGEHELQEEFGTRQRALKFYDKQVLNHLSTVMQEFIVRQEIMFIATSDLQGECDCSARFGEPGFVRVINENFLIYPEYRGNGVLASQGNIIENPHIGLIFADFFETTVGLHINGAARIINNHQLLKICDELSDDIINEINHGGKKSPERWIMIEVDEAYIHCSKHIPLLKKLDKKIHWGTDDVAAKGGDFFQLEQLSILDKIGGKKAMKKIADVFYLKLITDPKIKYLFEGEDITTQLQRLMVFLTTFFGDFENQNKPTSYTKEQKYFIGSHLTEQQFASLIKCLDSSLKELLITEEEIVIILDRIKPKKIS